MNPPTNAINPTNARMGPWCSSLSVGHSGTSAEAAFGLLAAKNGKGSNNKTNNKSKKVVPLDVDFTGLSMEVPHQRLSKAISSARMAKKLSQKDVAKILNVKSQVVADYEAGKAIPPNTSIVLLEKELGVKLPKPGTPAKEKKLAMEKRNMAEQAKKIGVGKAKAVKVVLADKKFM